MATATNAPSRWHENHVIGIPVLIVGLVVSIVGFAIFTVFLITRISDLTPDIQVVVPGTHEIQLEESGKYTVFYEYRSVVDNKVYSTGESLSGMIVTLQSKEDSQEVAMSRPSGSSTYETGGRAGVSVLEFEIEEPGTYILTADYSGGRSGPDIVLAIGKFNILSTILVALGIFFGTLIVGGGTVIFGAVITVRAFLKRRKAGTQIAAGQ